MSPELLINLVGNANGNRRVRVENSTLELTERRALKSNGDDPADGIQGEAFSHQGALRKPVGAVDEETALIVCTLLHNRKQDLIHSCEQTDLARETRLHCQFLFPAGITNKTPN